MQRIIFTAMMALLLTLPAIARTFDFKHEGNYLSYTVLDEEAKTCMVRAKIHTITGDLVIPSLASDGSNEYTVVGISPRAFHENNISYDITSVEIPNSVTRIGGEAFSGCQGITSVKMPSVISIGDYAFSGCSRLQSVEMPSVISIGNGAFSGCSRLQSVEMPSVTSIGDYAFSRCWLSAIEIPNTVKSIGSGAFYSCEKLISVTLPDSIEVIEPRTFESCTQLKSITIPKSVSEIGSRAFYGCGNLCDVAILNPAINIGSNAFEHCGSLASVTFADTENSQYNSTIGDEAFSNCWSLKSITLPDNVISIGAGAFRECKNLSSLVIPDNVKTLGGDFVLDCYNLTSLTIGKSLTTLVGYWALDKLYNLSEITWNVEAETTSINLDTYHIFPDSIQKFTFGESVKSIPQYFLSHYDRLDSVTILNPATNIGPRAFELCKKLTSVTIPYSGTDTHSQATIGEYAFSSCQNLSSVTIPKSVTKIGQNAFKYSTKLDSVDVEDIESWVKINFENQYSNPCYYAKRLTFGGKSIRKLSIPEGVTRINAYSFIKCEPLLTVNLPSTLKSVGSRAFDGCTGLQRHIFPDLESYLNVGYDNEKSFLTYGNNSKIYIGDNEYKALEEVDWPESLTYIPAYAFYNFDKLRRINIPETVTGIGEYAFSGCSSLEGITLPPNLTSIPAHCFSGCGLIKSVKISNQISSVGKSAFLNCTGINSVDISDLNHWATISFGDDAANPIFITKSFTVNGQSISHLDLKGIDSVAPYSFTSAHNLQTIRTDAFSVGEGAFNSCVNTTDIALVNAYEIGNKAFANCTGLNNIYVMTETPPAAASNTFSKYEGVNLYVPNGSVAAYENDRDCWWRFLDIRESNFAYLDDVFKGDQTSGISDIATEAINGEIDYSAPMEVYSTSGMFIGDSDANLPAGLYIIRQGNNVTKTVIK